MKIITCLSFFLVGCAHAHPPPEVVVAVPAYTAPVTVVHPTPVVVVAEPPPPVVLVKPRPKPGVVIKPKPVVRSKTVVVKGKGKKRIRVRR